jgi:RHS repeat-associated protein
LGSTSLVTDANGVVISEVKYKAWGEVRYSSGAEQTNYTYTGQYSYVSEFGLHFYNARWYDSSLSRFAQADTIVPSSQGVQGYDRYAYTNNNPINNTDPSGHLCVDENTWGYCGDKLPSPKNVKKEDRTRYIRDVARKYSINLSPIDVWGYSHTNTIRLGEYDQREPAPYGFSPNGSRSDDYYNDDNVFIETPDTTVTIFKRTFDECESDNCIAGVMAHEATHSWIEWLIGEKSTLPRTDQIPAEEVLADQVALQVSPSNPIILQEDVGPRHISVCQNSTGTDCSNPAKIIADYYNIGEIYNIANLVYGK